MKKDYLRREQPSFSSSYRRTQAGAKKHGWTIPSKKTLFRRLRKEVPAITIQWMRTGSLRHAYPDQVRTRNCFIAGAAVNGDALKFDKIYVDYGDGEISNKTTVWFMQDLFSSKILAWQVAKTENADMFRLATHELLGVTLPSEMWIDNTMAAANKALTGRQRHRHRFKKCATDPVGLLEQAGITVHFTNPDQEMSNPGVKPIERAFQGSSGIHGLMRNHPSLKDRGFSVATAIPYTEFKALLDVIVAEFNSMEGRKGKDCAGRSYDQMFADSIAENELRLPSEELRNMFLFDQEVATVSKDMSVSIKAGKGQSKHRFALDFINIERGEHVAVYFNPKNISDQAKIYDLDGKFLGTATWMPTVAYNDKDEAREHARLKRQRNKQVKNLAKTTARMSNQEYKQLYSPYKNTLTSTPAKTATVISPQEVQERLTHTVDSSKQSEFHKNFQNNINQLQRDEDDIFPVAAGA